MSNQLQHHGVKGMKWGIRRYQPYPGTKKLIDTAKQKTSRKNRIQTKERNLSERRSKIRENDGVANRKYIKTSKKLNVERRKIDMINSKKKKSEDRVTAKHNLKDAKRLVKEGKGSSVQLSSQEMKKIFGYDLTPKQVQAIRSSEWASITGKTKINRALKPVMSATVATLTPIAIYKGADFVAKNGKVSTDHINKAIDFYNNLKHSYDDDTLHHHGVKGMRWGIRRYQPYPKGEGKKGKFLGRRQNGSISSKSRELSKLKEARVSSMNKKSTKDIRKDTERLRNENELKRLSRRASKVGTRKDRQDYKRRSEMSDSELKRKVNRLIAKEEFKNESIKANRTTINTGKKYALDIAKVAVPVVGSYVAGKISSEGMQAALKDLKISPKEIDKIFNMVLK